MSRSTALNTSISRRLLCCAVALAAPTLAAAQDADAGGKRTRIALGAQVVPSYPGSDDVSWRPLFDFERADDGENFGFEAPDDNFGFTLFKSGGFAIGPVIDLAGKRTPEKLGAALPKVGTGVEIGGFVMQEVGENFRLYGELRKAVSGHDGLVGNVGADLVLRDGDAWLFSIGPRLKWADGKWHDAYFGVTPADAAATGLAAYDPGSGIHSYGAIAGAQVALNERWGLYGYAGYDRLTGDAADSPVTRTYGKRSQLSGGLAVSYTFGR